MVTGASRIRFKATSISAMVTLRRPNSAADEGADGVEQWPEGDVIRDGVIARDEVRLATELRADGSRSKGRKRKLDASSIAVSLCVPCRGGEARLASSWR